MRVVLLCNVAQQELVRDTLTQPTPAPRLHRRHHQLGQRLEAAAGRIDPEIGCRPLHDLANGGAVVAVRPQRADQASVPPDLGLVVLERGVEDAQVVGSVARDLLPRHQYQLAGDRVRHVDRAPSGALHNARTGQDSWNRGSLRGILLSMRTLRTLAIVFGAVAVVVLLVVSLVHLNDRLACGDPPHFGCDPGSHSPSGSYNDCVPC